MGSAVFLSVTIVLALGAVTALGEPAASSLLPVAAIAVAATGAEALAGGGADNVILPVAAAALLRAML